MSQEPIILPSDDLDTFEELVDALADGAGIKPPSEDDRDEYRAMKERLQNARP